ncbi:RsmB/NOP family class I SAM-dependent RNA methyltransferase [Hyphomicrobium sp.]|jgi:16S rRNA (cytosine967-C5)-methyltransferase|uniref:RsmB/NOP family class I SAM-dependent RNA methyltransferase n=1 Tax=Hyphomicrobium sp. TaxID=82 RepID=UPI002BBE2EBF|nr:RsmB/NOP family class I SAM-dependent RNA methyltransferase [Hyphomicrobium sp.]HVZ03881.1 RsmB/NOP family class I SAM-dependent RNA methyltransferase [Hyphomicrobium sp.]
MRPGARIAAAIEVLEAILNRYQPVAIALTDWGKAHRFAGSGDRNAIGGLVYDALRRRASLAWAMSDDSPRAMAIGAASSALGISPNAVVEACNGADHAPSPLTDVERAGLARDMSAAPDAIRADIPEWLWPSFSAQFGANAVAEGEAMARRAPADLRVNTLKSTQEKVLKALAPFGAEACLVSPIGIRVPAPAGAQRTPNLQAEAAFQAGWFEIQDEGSQIAALLSGAGPRKQILDLCAGAGGKTLALAALMQNTGQLYAYDADRFQLKPIFERIKRAGVRNVQVLRAGDEAALEVLGPRFDVVLADAPCTGTGTWRRRPDAKWRLKPEALSARQAEQRSVLARAASLVKPGGQLVYVTCSILPEENVEQVAAFQKSNEEFRAVPTGAAWAASGLRGDPPASADGRSDSLLLTPGHHGTDGFFIAVLARAS